MGANQYIAYVHSPIAQSVEQVAVNHPVGSSSLSRGARSRSRYASVFLLSCCIFHIEQIDQIDQTLPNLQDGIAQKKNSLISQGVYSAFQLSLLLLFLEKNEACCAGCQNKKNDHDDKTDIGLLLCLGCSGLCCCCSSLCCGLCSGLL